MAANCFGRYKVPVANLFSHFIGYRYVECSPTKESFIGPHPLFEQFWGDAERRTPTCRSGARRVVCFVCFVGISRVCGSEVRGL